MKIVDARTYVVGNPPPHYGGRYFIFLKLTTDSGIEGFGEVYAATFGPHTMARTDAVVGAEVEGHAEKPDVDLPGDIQERTAHEARDIGEARGHRSVARLKPLVTGHGFPFFFNHLIKGTQYLIRRRAGPPRFDN